MSLLPCYVLGQENYNVAFDSTYKSAIMQDNVIIDGAIYGIGGAICNTGECGYLSKYSTQGELYWTKEYAQIDINNNQVIHFREGNIYITGQANDSIATKTLVLDTSGVVLHEWDYSVEGAETNFPKEVFYDEEYYYFITKEVINYTNTGTVYKCDYAGNLVSRLVFPELVFANPIAVRPYRENLLVSINHRFEENCPFGLNGISQGATYLAEVDKETMTIIRDKKDVCYRSSVNDIYTSPTSEIMRTVIIRDSMQTNEDGNLGLIQYDDNWEVKNIIEYPHELAKGISNIEYTNDGDFYYMTIGENVDQSDGSSWPFGDLLIQKWTAAHELIWEKRYYSHNSQKRLKVKNFTIDEGGILHIVGYVWPDFPFTQTFDFWLFSVDENGCFNGDCRDEVDLDDLVNTSSVINNKIEIYPNPVSGVLFIQDLEEGTSVTIFDALGKIVFRTHYQVSIGLDLTDMSRGIYYMSLKNFPTQRIVKL